MELLDWLVLQEIYRNKSLSRAAEELFLSQPAITYRVNKMEAMFEQTLFVRSRQGTMLTEAGMKLLSFATRMIQFDREMRDSMMGDASEKRMEIEVGTTGNFFNQYHVNQVKAFQDMYPDIHLHIKVENSRSLYKQIKDGNLMMGVLRETEMSHWEEEHFMIFNDALQIAAAQPITEEYLMSAPMIRNLINPYLSNIVSEWIMSMYELVPVKSYIDITGDSRNVVAMIRAGLGWGILTESRLQSMDNLFLKPIHKTDGTPYRLNTYFVYRKEAYQYAAYSSYIDHFCAYFTQQRLKPIHE